MKSTKLYWELFRSTFLISALTFGGGFMIVPLMRKRFVEELNWIDEQKMLDLISIAQSSPGPIAVNASLIIGYQMGGIRGALITALGTVLPPLLIISVISYFYEKVRDNTYVKAAMRGMQAGIAAVICNVVADMGVNVVRSKNWLSIGLMIGVFAITFFTKVNIAWIILSCALIGLLNGVIASRRATLRKNRNVREDTK